MFGWEKVIEEGKVIGLKKDKQSITLEPGGQIELSGAPDNSICPPGSNVIDCLSFFNPITLPSSITFSQPNIEISFKKLPIPFKLS